MYPGTPTMTLSEESFDSDSTVRVQAVIPARKNLSVPDGTVVVGVQLPIHGARNSVLQI